MHVHSRSFTNRRRPIAGQFTLASVAAMLVASPSFAVIRYVDVNAPGPTHNGTSWTFAYTSLQTALAAANSGDQIWVADGVYKPTTSGDRTASFALPPGVEIYGGFNGSPIFESLISQRILGAFPSVLSGEIGNIFADTDNSYHVVTTAAPVSTTVHLDGFTIIEGYANGGGNDSLGGGMRNLGGAPLVRNCRFLGNFAATSGGAVYNSGGANNSAFHNCVFANNDSPAGSALDNQSNSVNITNCTIATNDSGAVRCLNGVGTSVIRNSILSDNSGSSQVNQITVTNTTLQINNCCVEGWTGSLGGAGNFGVDPRLVITSTLSGIPPVSSQTTDGTLRPGSPCIDAGNNAFLPTDGDDLDSDGNTAETIPYDIISSARRRNDFVVDSGAGTAPVVDIGAVEFVRTERVILVNHAATGANNGTTWQDAYTSLQTALAELADIKFGGPGQIWVAQGTYKPTTTTDRSISFEMVSGVRIYGGFIGNGTEGGLHQRDWIAHPTILSGDIGVAGNNADNSYHVVTSNGSEMFAIAALDGLVITAGNANGTGADQSGGGLRCFNATAFDPVIRNCRFIANNAFFQGGAVLSTGAEPVLFNCAFSGNTSGGSGGAVQFLGASVPVVRNCTFARNVSGGAGDAIHAQTAANAQIVNCLLWDNGTANTQLEEIHATAGTAFAINNCLIEGWTGALGGTNNSGADPLLTDPDGSDNVAGTLDDDLRISNCSPAIETGDNASTPVDFDDVDTDGSETETYPFDLDGLTRYDDDLGIAPDPLGPGPLDRGAFEFHGTSGGPCPADCSPAPLGDGQVNINDLLDVINTWGVGTGPADVDPPCGDGFIDINDLLEVINSWGPCH